MKFTGVTWFKALALSLATICLATVSGRAQSGPDWWVEYDVLNTGTADDYAVLNQGQLKNLAWAAYQHIQADYPLGAENELALHVDNFIDLGTGTPRVGTSTDDFAAANLGQLKAMAYPFYERLIEIGYLTNLPAYLDPNALVQSDPFAAANIGQAKNLFSFDLVLDTDSDGLPDWWEEAEFAGTGAVSGADEVASSGITYTEAFGLGVSFSISPIHEVSSEIGLVVHSPMN